MYSIGTQEFNRRPPHIGYDRAGNSLEEDIENVLEREREARANLAQKRLAANLIAFDIIALGLGSLCAYLLARRTVHPIEEALEAQTRFSSDAAHELRTPLSIMQAEIEVLLRGTSPSKPAMRATLQSNHEEVIRLQALTDRLLLLAQAEEVTRSPAALDEIATVALNTMLSLAQSRNSTIQNNVSHIAALTNSNLLADVLTILLDNALKYSHKGAKITLTSRSKGRYAYLDVADDGPGIAKADLPHIFDTFYRADLSRTKNHTIGNGLGLSLARRIMKTLHGEISVTSKLGEGSKFTVRLPLQ